MPNWCENYISFVAEPNVLEEIKERYMKDKYVLDFSSLPYKESDSLSGQWGTKWCPDITDIAEHSDAIHISCVSPWSPPLLALAQISELHPVSIHIEYAEPGINFAGEATIARGVIADKCGECVRSDDGGFTYKLTDN